MIRLFLLGPTTCRGPSGEDLQGVVRSRKRLGLLAYLAVADPKGFHRRDTLLGLLWPESDQKHARGALRQAVRHLRAELGEAVVSRGSEELGLDWDRFWCDAVAFRDALDGGRLQGGLDLYQRDLLEGFYLTGVRDFEEWLDRARTTLQIRGAQAAWALADQAAHPIEAAGWARRAVRFTPHGESAIRRLMTMLAQRGDATGALLEYERFRKRVEEDLGMGPGQETRKLAEEIREGTASPRTSLLESPLPEGAPYPIVKVSVDDEAPAPAHRETSTDDDEARVTRLEPVPLKRWLTPVGALVTTTLGFGAFFGAGALSIWDRPEASFAFGTTALVAGEDGLDTQPALSPSGDRLAYAVGEPGDMELYVRRVSGGRPLPLTSDLAGWHARPAWAPDGEQVAFITSEPNGPYKVQVVAATGGEPRTLFVAEPGEPLDGLTWSPDGREVAFTNFRTIVRLDIDTGNLRPIADAWAPHSQSWSPDGRWIAFVSENSEYAYGSNSAPSSIWVVPAEGGQPIRLTEDGSTNQSPVWSGPETLIFVSNRDGTPDLYSIHLAGDGRVTSQPVRQTTGLSALRVSLSEQGSKLAYAVPAVDGDLWSIPWPEGDQPATLDGANRLTSDRQVIETFDLSPDGKWIAYDSNRDGTQDIYKIPVVGGSAFRLTQHPSDDFAPAWSPDGREIAFYSFRKGNRDLFVTDADGRARVPLTFDPGSDAFPYWSPDGQSIVFHHNPVSQGDAFATLHSVSRDDEGRWHEPRQLTEEHSENPVYSADGRFIAFGASTHVGVLEVATGEVRSLLRGIHRRGRPVWSPYEQSLLVGLVYEGRPGIWNVPLDSGAPTLLVDIDADRLDGLWFDTDGRKIYVSLLSSKESDIWVARLDG